MPVAELQSRLESCYEITLPYRVEDFTTTDLSLARLLDGEHPHQPHERLLMQQTGDDLSMSLYLDADLLARLETIEELYTAGHEHMADLSLALEGVSHFVYMAWNASHERPVSLLELELQAEVDKFVMLLALREEQGELQLGELHQQLFENVSFAETLDTEQLQRYRTANRYAARYCWSLGKQYPQLKTGGGWLKELRRFYRLQHDAKLRHIHSLH